LFLPMPFSHQSSHLMSLHSSVSPLHFPPNSKLQFVSEGVTV
jgi:hypothetical protein